MRRARAWWPKASAVVALAGAAAGCQLLVAIRGTEEALVDASVNDVVVAVDAGPFVGACGNDPPAPPPPSAVAGKTTIELVFSFVSLDTEAPVADVPLCKTSGFRLDKQDCGIETAPDSGGVDADVDADADARVAEVPAQCRTQCPNVDAGDDRPNDNAGGELFRRLRTLPSAASLGVPEPNAALEAGFGNMMVRILSFNEQPDDDDVDLEFYALTGLVSDSRILDAEPKAAVWDRRSPREWSVDPESFADATLQLPKYKAKGYVARNVLVSHPNRLPVAFSNFSAALDAVTLTGELVPHGGGLWTLIRGRIGGDLPVGELLARYQSLPIRDDVVCNAVVPQLVEATCDARDRATRAGDCDALSFGMSFGMVQGKFGLSRAHRIGQNACEVRQCAKK